MWAGLEKFKIGKVAVKALGQRQKSKVGSV